MIKPPGKNKSKEGWRALLEAFAQLMPLTAFLSRVYQTTFPSNAGSEREEWEAQVSAMLNSKLKGKLQTFGRVDFNEQRYSWARSQGISSMTDFGVGRHSVNLLAPITEDYIVEAQADDGDVRITQKSETNFAIEIRKDGEPIDSGFVFIVSILQ